METAEINDAGLVAECLAGNREAFGRIVTRYQTLICSLAYSRTGSLGLSEELAQETFVAAWRQLGQLREPAKLRSWLCQITRNLSAEAIRQQGREPSHAAEPLDAAHELPATGALPAELAVSNEEAAILWRSLENIPEVYREPLVLFYRENQSVAAVAQNLELSEDAVKQRLSRGRKLLHEEVLGFIAGALKQTSPGKTFAAGVLAALALPATSAKAATVGTAVGTATGTTAAKAGAATVTKAGGMFGAAGGFLPVLGSLFFLFKNVRHQLAENEANLAGGPLTPEKRREIRDHRQTHGSKAQVYIYLGIGCNMAGLTIMEFTQVRAGHQQHLLFAEILAGFTAWLFIQAWRSRPR